jgi:hypothetical protein
MGLYFITMNDHSVKRIHKVTALIFLTAIIFYLFFQINKRSPFVEANPFANDPYDAVGSIAIQVALLISLLSYGRVIRWRDDPGQANQRLILHGNILVLVAIFITLCSDALAELVQPTSSTLWSNILRLELGLMFILSLVCALALWVVFRGVSTTPPPPNLTPADAIDDLWSLVRVPIGRSSSVFPPAMVEWVKRFNSDFLFAHIPWVNPRLHPWRFTAAVGLLVGVLLVIAKLQEGLPPSLAIGVLVMGISISVELVATLLGFAIFGGYLGLRPALIKKDLSI